MGVYGFGFYGLVFLLFLFFLLFFTFFLLFFTFFLLFFTFFYFFFTFFISIKINSLCSFNVHKNSDMSPLDFIFFRGLAREPLEGNGKYQNMISHDIM